MSDTSTVACLQCGSAVPRNAPFCLVCGTPVASRTHAAALGAPPAPDTSWRPAPAEAPIPRSSVLRAEYGWRVLAWLMDYAITAVIGLAVTIPIVSLGAIQVLPSGSLRVSIGPLGTLLILLAWYAYPIAMLFLQAFRGFSLGMLTCGIRVVDLATLRRPGIGRILIRDLVVFAGRLVFGIGELVVYLSPLWDSTRRLQGWHDKAARTWLIDVRRGPNPVTADPSRLVEDEWTPPGAPVPVPAGSGAPVPQHPSAPPTIAVPEPASFGAPAAPASFAAPAAPAAPGSFAAPAAPESAGFAPPAAPQSPRSEPAPFAPSAPAQPSGPGTAGPAITGPARIGDPQPTTPVQFGAFTPPPLPTGDAGSSGLIDSIPGFSAPRPPAGPETRDPAAGSGGDLDSTRLADSAPLGRAAVAASFTLDSGEVFPITSGGVIGRDPVPASGAMAIRLPGDALSVSKTHLEFGLDGGAVWVLDRNSTNGSSIVDPRGFERVLTSGRREVVGDGDRVRIGTRSFTVRSGLRSA
ncbi:hypothetical protein GCM10010988_30110 [Cnuibacter physcomitrellae]|nr:RDD family protein [Cnuibacter physcomitrellae]GGI40644.1 hypothetical protein GCM10010988_30110 [Cnuibacter physcomitrellae]